MRVLYVHGLEAGPKGTKGRYLKKHFIDTFAEDMETSIFNIRKKNSLIRNLFRNPEALFYVTTMFATFGGFYAFAIFPFFALYRRQSLIEFAFKSMLEKCVEIQKNAIETHKPDILVGSSLGGAVVVELIRRKIWTGKALILCPAFQLIQEHCGNPGPYIFPSNMSRVLICHGTHDETVPLAHSIALSTQGNFELQKISFGDHRLRLTCGEHPDFNLINLTNRAMNL